jgi:hypothetical protein
LSPNSEPPSKIVLVDRKKDTYTSLKKLVMDEYFPGEAELARKFTDPLYRLRAYNVQFQIMLETYEGKEDLTLELLKIYPMKTLALESRKSVDEAWEVYDPSLMEIRLTFWSKDILEKFNSYVDYADLSAKRVKINKEMNMQELKTYIESEFKLENAIVMKRTPMMQNQAVEILSAKPDKGLNELRVFEGINLFVEEKGEAHPN